MQLMTDGVFRARQGYNLLAKHYSKWHWYKFWRQNEGPIINEWLKTVEGIGLDAGCGNAPYLLDYSNDTSHIYLFDFSEGMLAEAIKRIKRYIKFSPSLKKTITVIQADINYLPVKNVYVNYILCSRVLSNIQDFNKTLAEFSRVLKPGGSLLLTDIHPLHIYKYTGINTDKGRINIETYKHETKNIIEYANLLGLKLDRHQEFSLLNIKVPPPVKHFEKIYNSPSTPIFMVLEFTKVR